jgi:putative ABC transport system substrate-binding protein
VDLAVRHAIAAIAAIYAAREFADAGGLMSYGIGLTDVYRRVGVYAGQFLKGAEPPVYQSYSAS